LAEGSLLALKKVVDISGRCANIVLTITKTVHGGTNNMATKDTKYGFYASVTLPNGKVRHLFTNDTVARTKVLLKAGIDMSAVKWIAIETPATKAEIMANKPSETVSTAQAVA
jgi:hypothetical protein